MHTKRIASGQNKTVKWIKTARGPHERGESVALSLIIRDLGWADKAKEARKIITEGMVLVDGKTCRDPSYGLGLMDVLSLPKAKKNYRIVAAKKGLKTKEIPAKEAKLKLCRVTGKRLVSGGKTQLNFHDGSNLVTDKKVKVNDCVVLELPKRNIKDVIEYKVGDTALVVKGRHRSETGQVKDILAATASRESLTTIEDYQTLTEYVFVVGKDKPVIEI